MLRVKVVEYSPEQVEQSFNEILLAFDNACHAADKSVDDFNSQQKERIANAVDNLITNLQKFRIELVGRPITTRTIVVGQGGTKSGISKSMRDYVWTYVKSNKHRIHTKDFASHIAHTTGMNGNSAFIYVSMIGNLLKGQDNTRTMKFDDLVYYMECIKRDCSPSEYRNALSSIEKSVHYWDTKLTGNFGQKASQLVRQLKAKEGL
jgi:hypothetical protein